MNMCIFWRTECPWTRRYQLYTFDNKYWRTQTYDKKVKNKAKKRLKRISFCESRRNHASTRAPRLGSGNHTCRLLDKGCHIIESAPCWANNPIGLRGSRTPILTIRLNTMPRCSAKFGLHSKNCPNDKPKKKVLRYSRDAFCWNNKHMENCLQLSFSLQN